MKECPQCGSPRIHRSRSRHWWERLRREFTEKRPFRCKACGWRGWGIELEDQRRAPAVSVPRAGGDWQPNFRAIDKALDQVPPEEPQAEK